MSQDPKPVIVVGMSVPQAAPIVVTHGRSMGKTMSISLAAAALAMTPGRDRLPSVLSELEDRLTPPPRPDKELTKYDLDAIEKAEAKRLRKAAKRERR